MPRRVQLGFLLVAVVPVALGIMAIRNAVRLVDANERVAQSNGIVKEVEKLLSNLKDAELAGRDFILSGDEQYVRLIQTARRQANTHLSRIEKARAEKRWVEVLKLAVPQKFEELDRMIVARRSGDSAAAQAQVLQPSTDDAMGSIRRVAQALVREENVILYKNASDESRSFMNTLVVFVTVLLINMVLVYGIFWLTRREARIALELNADLERRVAARTEELQRSNEELQQFAYVASHDMKEPMRMIASYAGLLRRRYEGKLDAEADRLIGFMIDGVRRMDRLITDLLDYSLAGQVHDTDLHPIDANAVLRSVLDNLQSAIRDSSAVVTHDPLPSVVFSDVRLGQLLQNLIANAIKYHRPGRPPQIHVTATREQGSVVFSVRDNGQGIPRDQLEQVFGLFKRLHGKDVDGTGIGLATCRRIVQRAGGRMWVESEPGKGSTFFFLLPAQVVPAASVASV
ncbi:MAG TPA: ATP-binding protein [Bryobacteraceae bacterium]|nr:ATP-binding protein [Bryobacteraceae bacterium]